MKRTNIPIYIDLLFCLVIMPPIIMLVPVDRWIVHHTVFMLTLIVYLYGLYFVYLQSQTAKALHATEIRTYPSTNGNTCHYHPATYPIPLPTGTK